MATWIRPGPLSARNQFRGDGAMHTSAVTVDCN